MNFLALCQHLVQYAGIADSGPSTVNGQVGDFQKAINYVQDAHAEIQNLHFDWDFLWGHSAFTTSPGLAVYSGASGLGIWDAERVFLDGEPLAIREWADYWPEARDNGRPEFGVIRPDNQLLLVPTPDDDYVVAYDYFRRPKVLEGNADEPDIPPQFRTVIIGRALMLYGNYEAAPDAKIQGQELFQVFLEQLQRHQLSRRQKTHGRMDARDIQVVAE